MTSLNELAYQVHLANINWWRNPVTGERITRNKGELLMLMVSELAEAMEGVRKNLPDDKLPERKMEEVELADCLIRMLDYCGGFGLDLDGAFYEKMDYNTHREDHKLEHRKGEHGKKF